VHAQLTASDPVVEIVFECSHEVVAHAALGAPQVDEIQRAAIGHQDPDRAALDHAGQIPGPGLLLQIDRQRLVGRCGCADHGRQRQQQ